MKTQVAHLIPSTEKREHTTIYLAVTGEKRLNSWQEGRYQRQVDPSWFCASSRCERTPGQTRARADTQTEEKHFWQDFPPKLSTSSYDAYSRRPWKVRQHVACLPSFLTDSSLPWGAINGQHCPCFHALD